MERTRFSWVSFCWSPFLWLVFIIILWCVFYVKFILWDNKINNKNQLWWWDFKKLVSTLSSPASHHFRGESKKGRVRRSALNKRNHKKITDIKILFIHALPKNGSEENKFEWFLKNFFPSPWGASIFELCFIGLHFWPYKFNQKGMNFKFNLNKW